MLGCAPSDFVVVPKYNLVVFAAEWVIDHVAPLPSAIVLVREMSAQTTDGLVTWTSAMGAFYPLDASCLERDALVDLMENASSVEGALVIVTSHDRLDSSSSLVLPDSDLEDLVRAADAVILGAYDGEGYVCWSRLATVKPADQAEASRARQGLFAPTSEIPGKASLN